MANGQGICSNLNKTLYDETNKKTIFIIMYDACNHSKRIRKQKHAKEINCMANVENANGKEHKWEKIMDAIIQVESGGNPNAKGGNSLGILQITPILVKECNDILKDKGLNKRYKLSDRLSTKNHTKCSF